MFKKKKIDVFPIHIAFIMDGNRRWAVRRGLNKMIGHKHGANVLRRIVETLSQMPIKYASFFAFSTENWKRDFYEIEFLFDLFYDFLEENKHLFCENNVKVVCMGQLERFPEKLQSALAEIQKKTAKCTGLVVNLAMSYGGRDDIVQATTKLAKAGEEITEQSVADNLFSAPAPDIDLLIRTSGEKRLSNFMLFQMAYSELYFTKTLWPDFNRKELSKALVEFSKRNRRFGGK